MIIVLEMYSGETLKQHIPAMACWNSLLGKSPRQLSI